MKTPSSLFQFLALSLALNASAVVALHAAEPVKPTVATKSAGAADDTNDGACGCDDDEGAAPAPKVVGSTPAASTTIDTTVASPDKAKTKKQAKVTVSTSTHTTGTGDGKTVKETTRAKYVNGELVSGSTTKTSGNDAAVLSRPIDPVPATPAPESSNATTP